MRNTCFDHCKCWQTHIAHVGELLHLCLHLRGVANWTYFLHVTKMCHPVLVKAPNWEYGGIFGDMPPRDIRLTLPLNPDVYQLLNLTAVITLKQSCVGL